MNFHKAWTPPSSVEEKLKSFLIPPPLHLFLLSHFMFRKGEPDLKMLHRVVDPKRASVDAGANRGIYTFWLQRFSRHVYAYEPNPKMFEILKRGVKGNVTVKPIALSNESSERMLRIPMRRKGYSNQGASLDPNVINRNYGEVEVTSKRLDEEDLDNVGFIKIDVEGHEFEVLEGARETIRRDRPVLLIEIEENRYETPIETLLKRVTDLGYKCFFTDRDGLKGMDGFDPVARHRAPQKESDYIFNFLFLPLI